MQETYCMHTLITSTVTAAASAAPAATPAAMQQYETAVKTVKVRSSKDSICRTKRVRVAARQQPLLSTPSTFRPCPILAAKMSMTNTVLASSLSAISSVKVLIIFNLLAQRQVKFRFVLSWP